MVKRRAKKSTRSRTPKKIARSKKPIRSRARPVRTRARKQKVRARKPVAKKLVLKTSPTRTYLGTVLHYYTSLGVGIIQLAGSVQQGDWISLEGTTTRFRQKVESMQLDHEPTKEAHAGQTIGVRVRDRVREGDKVYRD